MKKHPCNENCCNKPEIGVPEHECSKESVCEDCYGLECSNCGSSCYCEL